MNTFYDIFGNGHGICGCGEWHAKREHFDYFIFGHQHHPFDMELEDKCRYINIGDWQTYDTYAVMQADNCELKYFKME